MFELKKHRRVRFDGTEQGWIQIFLREGVLYVGHHGWLAKKTLGFRWSKKVEVTLDTVSIFKFLHFYR